MKIEFEDSFKEFLHKGINLFLGAGFSINAFDSTNRKIPLGNELRDELVTKYNVPSMPLSQLASILNAKYKNEFRQYLCERFCVDKYDDSYCYLNKINIKNIFTTNIDNLVNKIYQLNESFYLNDVFLEGPIISDRTAIRYICLHGSVNHPERSLIFDSFQIANTFSDTPRLWNYLSESVEQYPTIFWGYSLTDSGVLQALSSSSQLRAEQKTKWIVLHQERDDQIQYFSSLGFRIIIAENVELLKYLSKITPLPTLQPKSVNRFDLDFPKNVIPLPNSKFPTRPLSEFYLGAAPIWSDIFNKHLPKTSHYFDVKDKSLSKKHLIILGMPASGKTTLIMQLASAIEFFGIKLIFDSISVMKAELIIKRLSGTPAIIFIDNLSDSIKGFLLLSLHNNIQLIACERQHNFEIISHLIDKDKFIFKDISELRPEDRQNIYESIPQSIRMEQFKDNEVDPYIFEIIKRNTNSPYLGNRFESVIMELEKKDKNLTDFLVLCCYVHSCRTPVSFEMLYSYFSKDVETYNDIFELRDILGSLINENGFNYKFLDDSQDDQDYYYPRSTIIAETIMELIPSYILKRVLNKFIMEVPLFRICNYDTFKKRAYDASLIKNVYENSKEGKIFYEKVFDTDPTNPFVLQQGALYLARKKDFVGAFYWIDRALNLSDNKYFSIRNSHAIILFDANISLPKTDRIARESLDTSMQILQRCYVDDKRKLYHCLRFADQSIQYFDKYDGDNSSKEYLKMSYQWLCDEERKQSWNEKSIIRLKRFVENRLKSI